MWMGRLLFVPRCGGGMAPPATKAAALSSAPVSTVSAARVAQPPLMMAAKKVVKKPIKKVAKKAVKKAEGAKVAAKMNCNSCHPKGDNTKLKDGEDGVKAIKAKFGMKDEV